MAIVFGAEKISSEKWGEGMVFLLIVRSLKLYQRFKARSAIGKESAILREANNLKTTAVSNFSVMSRVFLKLTSYSSPG